MTPLETYREAQHSMVHLCSELTPDDARRMTITCPDWSVKDVLAHVVGIPADIATNRSEGRGTDAWTAAQVAMRSENTIDEILTEWSALHGFIEELLEEQPDLGIRLAGDIVSHEHDIRTALGRHGNREAPVVAVAAARYAEFFVERVAKAGLAPVAVIVESSIEEEGADGDVTVGSMDAPVSLRGSAFELLRSLSGRRSRPQVEALDWSGDPREHIAVISAYGAFPIKDIPE